MTRRIVLLTAVLLWRGVCADAQTHDDHRVFAGVLVGVSALSGDAQAAAAPPAASISLYNPTLGAALNLFAGWHATEYVSLQGSYSWNRNDLTLVSSVSDAGGAGAYEQRRNSTHHAVVADALLYFRRRDSRIRPYLGTGLSIARFTSTETGLVAAGLPAPPGRIASTHVGLRSHVGIDLALTRRLSLRYSFSETIGSNPISPYLTPPGQRGLMNFQNLFGVLTTF